MIDYFLEKTEEIKRELRRLKTILREIPSQRKINCRIEQFQGEDSKFIYKPRFYPQIKLIDTSIKLDFIKLLEDINNYLKEYSPDNFKNIKQIFKGDLYYKKSIIFLLENDVWATDEIYGDYLVEVFEYHYEIFYYRWNRKINQLDDQDILIQIDEFIMSDAIYQIQTQFDKLWELLEIEIEKSLKNFESLKDRYAGFKKNITLEDMLGEGKKSLNINQFLSIFYLGYVLEHSIRLKLNKMKEKVGLRWLIYLCKRNSIFIKSEAKICNKIKEIYNKTKHEVDYRVQPEILKQLYEEFNPIFLKLK